MKSVLLNILVTLATAVTLLIAREALIVRARTNLMWDALNRPPPQAQPAPPPAPPKEAKR